MTKTFSFGPTLADVEIKPLSVDEIMTAVDMTVPPISQEMADRIGAQMSRLLDKMLLSAFSAGGHGKASAPLTEQALTLASLGYRYRKNGDSLYLMQEPDPLGLPYPLGLYRMTPPT